MLAELVTVTTIDGVDLDGALYLPAGTARRRECIFIVHGQTWNFYRGPSRWLPPLLVEAGYPCLSLNMRDHDLQEPKDFELAHHDLRAGINYCYDRGASKSIIVAHGFGCNKVACYPALSQDSRVGDYVFMTLGSEGGPDHTSGAWCFSTPRSSRVRSSLCKAPPIQRCKGERGRMNSSLQQPMLGAMSCCWTGEITILTDNTPNCRSVSSTGLGERADGWPCGCARGSPNRSGFPLCSGPRRSEPCLHPP